MNDKDVSELAGKIAPAEGPALYEAAGIKASEWAGLMNLHEFLSSELIYFLSLKGRLIQVSRNWAEMLGHDPGEVKGQPFRDFVHPDDLRICQAFINLIIKRDTPQKGFEYRIRHKDGRYRWHRAAGAVLKDESGRLKGYIGLAQDITDLKKSSQRLTDSEQRLDMISEATGHTLWELNLASGKMAWSGAMFEELGYDQNKIPADISALLRLVQPDDGIEMGRALEAHCRRKSKVFKSEYRIKTTGSKWKWFMSTGRVTDWDQAGNPIRMVGLCTDVSERKLAEEELKRSEHSLKSILEASPIGVAVVRPDGKVAYCNNRLAEMRNMPRNILVGADVSSFYADPKAHRSHLQEFAEKGSINDREVEFVLSGGRKYWALVTWIPMEFEGEAAILAWMYDINDLKRAEAQLRELATTDGLTGLFNRRYFMELACREFERSKRYSKNLSLLMIDADHFKQINDTYGHEIGDRVLEALARIGRETLRDIDIFGRIGGEEFAVLLPETDANGAMNVAERLRRNIEEARVPTDEGEAAFTVSIGLIGAGPGTEDVEAMLKAADRALYAAKEKGRNRVEVNSIGDKACPAA